MSLAHICEITCLFKTIKFPRQKKASWSADSNLAELVSCSDRHSEVVAAGQLVWPTTRIKPKRRHLGLAAGRIQTMLTEPQFAPWHCVNNIRFYLHSFEVCLVNLLNEFIFSSFQCFITLLVKFLCIGAVFRKAFLPLFFPSFYAPTFGASVFDALCRFLPAFIRGTFHWKGP